MTRPALRTTPMPTVLAILSNILSVLAALAMLVLLLASGANAKPAAITQIKWMLAGVSAGTLISLAASIWLLTHQRPWPAVGVGLAPLLGVVILLVILTALEW